MDAISGEGEGSGADPRGEEQLFCSRVELLRHLRVGVKEHQVEAFGQSSTCSILSSSPWILIRICKL